MTWTVPREWEGETCFILGGGESLKGFDAEILRGHGRVLAIKESGLTMCPWADCLYWADKHWCDGNKQFEANGPRLHLHTGKYKVTRIACDNTGGHDVKVLKFDKHAGFSTDPTTLSGVDSGSNAINLAALFGAARIVLLGFDMHGVNWDGRKRRAHTDGSYKTRFMPSIAKMVVPLKAQGIEVLNATPKTALGCFPLARLEDILARRKRKTQEPDAFAPAESYEAEPVHTGLDEPKSDDEIAADNARADEIALSFDGDPAQEDLRAERLVEPDDGTPLEHTGLEMYEGREIMRTINSLGANEHCFVTIRTRGADVITRRSPGWWRLQLETAFRQVLEHPARSGVVRFECHKTPV